MILVVKEDMGKLVVLSFGNGEVINGFASVRAQLWDASSGYPIQVTGSLPPAPDLAVLSAFVQPDE